MVKPRPSAVASKVPVRTPTTYAAPAFVPAARSLGVSPATRTRCVLVTPVAYSLFDDLSKVRLFRRAERVGAAHAAIARS